MKGWIRLIFQKRQDFYINNRIYSRVSFKRDMIPKGIFITICSIILGGNLKICFWKK